MREGKILIVYLGASDVLSRFSQIKYLILSTALIVHQFAVMLEFLFQCVIHN